MVFDRGDRFIQSATRMIKQVSRGTLRSGAFAVVDQMVMSGSNFVVLIAAARVLGPADFGLFTVLYIVLVFTMVPATALVTTPHSVLSASRHADGYRVYTTSAVGLQILLATALGVLLLGAGFTIQTFDSNVGTMFLFMTLAAIAWQFHEFMRKVMYKESRIVSALLVDTIAYGARLPVVGSMILAGNLSGAYLFLTFGALWGVAAITGIVILRGSFTRAMDVSIFYEHWEFGRWILAKELSAQLPRFITPVIMSSVLSVGAYGAYRAFSQLMQGASVPVAAMHNFLRPRLAADAQIGARAVERTLRPFMFAGGVLFTLAAVILISFRESLLGFVYGAEYVPYASAIFLIMLTPILAWQNEVMAVGFVALQRTKVLFTATTIGAVVGVTLGSIALILFGLPAVGAAGILATLTSLLWVGRLWRKELKRDVQHKEQCNNARPETPTMRVSE